MVMERFKQALEGETLIQRLENRVDDKAHELRNRPSKRLQRNMPRLGQRNIGEGVGAGLVEAGTIVILEDILGVPFGANVDVVDSEPSQGGTIYTVNVNAHGENLARARAFLQSTTGFSSVFTDTLDIKNTEVLNTRIARDTYQVEILVQD